jgi:Bor protein
MTRNVVLAIFASLPLYGCHTMRFDVSDGSVGSVVQERKSFFVDGLFPTRTVDVASHCPAGVVAIKEETRFLDGFFSLVTLSIYTPRTSWYYCAAEKN